MTHINMKRNYIIIAFFICLFIPLINSSTCVSGVYPCNENVQFNNPTQTITNTITSGNSTNFTNYVTTNTDQSGLTGKKEGSFSLNTTGQGNINNIIADKSNIFPDDRFSTIQSYGAISFYNGVSGDNTQSLIVKDGRSVSSWRLNDFSYPEGTVDTTYQGISILLGSTDPVGSSAPVFRIYRNYYTTGWNQEVDFGISGYGNALIGHDVDNMVDNGANLQVAGNVTITENLTVGANLQVGGDTAITKNLTVGENAFFIKNISAPNVCYSSGYNCNLSAGDNSSWNESYARTIFYNISNPNNYTNNTNLSQFTNDLPLLGNNNISNKSFYWNNLSLPNYTQFTSIANTLSISLTWLNSYISSNWCVLTGCNMNGNLNNTANITAQNYCNSTGTCKDLSQWGGSTIELTPWTSNINANNNSLLNISCIYSTNVNVSTTISGTNYGNYTTSILNASLRGWWRMDDMNTSSGVIEYFGRNNMTNFSGAKQNSFGKFGSSFKFDGSANAYMSTPASTNLNFGGNQMTVSAWVFLTKSTDYDVIYSQRSGCGGWNSAFYMRGSNECSGTAAPFFTMNGDNPRVCGSGVMGNNTWYHMVGIYNGTCALIYINGILNASSCATITIPSGAIQTVIGWDTCSGNNMDGYIDDFMIWNRSLTATEVQSIYNSSQYYLYKNQSNVNQALNYTMYVQYPNATITTCVDNQCGGSSTTTYKLVNSSICTDNTGNFNLNGCIKYNGGTLGVCN